VESQFTGSPKAYASTLIKRLVTEKYNGGGIREHILRMSNMASKLKPMNMELPWFLLLCLENMIPLKLITTYTQRNKILTSSLPYVCKKENDLRAHMVIPSTK
jgi:hypothetical protein